MRIWASLWATRDLSGSPPALSPACNPASTACPRTAGADSNGACDLTQNAPPNPHYAGNMEWSFNFDDGFEGTDEDNKMFYVMVYYPIQQGCGAFC